MPDGPVIGVVYAVDPVSDPIMDEEMSLLNAEAAVLVVTGLPEPLVMIGWIPVF